MNEVEYGWQVVNCESDEVEASGVCPSLPEAQREAGHYAAQYSRDGVFQVRVFESRKLMDFVFGDDQSADDDSSEPECVRGLPDGYYLISREGDDQRCLVYLYAHDDFGGERNVAFGPQDGGALVPVSDLMADSVLTPVQLALHQAYPVTLEDLNDPEYEGVR